MKKIVNGLTLLRLIATFLLPIIWSLFKPPVIILIVALVLLTDFFDGMLARKFHVQTLFGSIADQIADKMFGIMIIVIISKYYPIFIVLVICELTIAIINVLAALRGAHTKSSFLGRVKMWIVGITTVIGLLAIFIEEITNIVNVPTLLEYCKYFMENKNLFVTTSVLVTTGAEIMVIVDYVRRIKKDLTNNQDKIKYRLKNSEELNKVLFDTEYYIEHKKDSLVEHFLKS